MNEDVKVRVLIVTSNSVNQIDRTMESLDKQTFKKENTYVYLVDFASTDGTYEKLLSYDKYHLAVYRVSEDVKKERQLAHAQVFLNYGAFSEVTFGLSLTPGDTVVPEFLQFCTKTLMDNLRYRPVMLMCETDIRQTNGNVVKQTPLFEKSFLLDGKKDMLEYLRRGYRHRVMCFGTTGVGGRKYHVHELNDLTNWNKKFFTNVQNNAIYINRSMACTQEKEDGLENIVAHYAHAISCFRYYEYQHEHPLDSRILAETYANLANGTLWNSFQKIQRRELKEAEDCLLFSEVIYPQIVETRVYQSVKRHLEIGHIDCENSVIEELFSDEKTLCVPSGSIPI